MSHLHWGDDSDSDDDNNDDGGKVILNIEKPDPDEEHITTTPFKGGGGGGGRGGGGRDRPNPWEQNHRGGRGGSGGRGYGGGGDRYQHDNYRDKNRGGRSGGRGGDYRDNRDNYGSRDNYAHGGGGGGGGRYGGGPSSSPQRFQQRPTIPDWKAAAKSASILNDKSISLPSSNDGEPAGSSWMAQRLAKQKEHEQERLEREKAEKEKELELQHEKRRSQALALKQALGAIKSDNVQKDKEHEEEVIKAHEHAEHLAPPSPPPSTKRSSLQQLAANVGSKSPTNPPQTGSSLQRAAGNSTGRPSSLKLLAAKQPKINTMDVSSNKRRDEAKQSDRDESVASDAGVSSNGKAKDVKEDTGASSSSLQRAAHAAASRDTKHVIETSEGKRIEYHLSQKGAQPDAATSCAKPKTKTVTERLPCGSIRFKVVPIDEHEKGENHNNDKVTILRRPSEKQEGEDKLHEGKLNGADATSTMTTEEKEQSSGHGASETTVDSTKNNQQPTSSLAAALAATGAKPAFSTRPYKSSSKPEKQLSWRGGNNTDKFKQGIRQSEGAKGAVEQSSLSTSNKDDKDTHSRDDIDDEEDNKSHHSQKSHHSHQSQKSYKSHHSQKSHNSHQSNRSSSDTRGGGRGRGDRGGRRDHGGGGGGGRGRGGRDSSRDRVHDKKEDWEKPRRYSVRGGGDKSDSTLDSSGGRGRGRASKDGHDSDRKESSGHGGRDGRSGERGRGGRDSNRGGGRGRSSTDASSDSGRGRGRQNQRGGRGGRDGNKEDKQQQKQQRDKSPPPQTHFVIGQRKPVEGAL